MLAEIALGALARDATAERRANVAPLAAKSNVIPLQLKKASAS
jgi:hypothetical protein